MNVNNVRIIDDITKSIFQGQMRNMNQRLLTIIQENNGEGTTPEAICYGVHFRGDYYVPIEYAQQWKSLRTKSNTTLKMHLVKDMAKFKTDREKLDLEYNNVKQALLTVIKTCRSVQDIVNILPSTLLSMIKHEGFNKTQTAEETYKELGTDPKHIAQFNKVIPTIEFYITAQLIY